MFSANISFHHDLLREREKIQSSPHARFSKEINWSGIFQTWLKCWKERRRRRSLSSSFSETKDSLSLFFILHFNVFSFSLLKPYECATRLIAAAAGPGNYTNQEGVGRGKVGTREVDYPLYLKIREIYGQDNVR